MSDHQHPASVASAAPARLDAAAVEAQARQAAAEATILAMLEAFPGPSALLNDRRQIVAANAAFRALAAGLRAGDRPGDALGCVEAARGGDGCGTAPACLACGAARSFLHLERGDPGPVRAECLITRRGPDGEEGLEFELGATCLPGGLRMLALRDISGEKRRRVLERCFLHDALNVAGGVQGLAELAATGQQGFSRFLPGAATALVEELRCHQALLAAESGELVPEPVPLRLAELFDEVVALYGGHRVGRGWRVDLAADGLEIVADRVLLRRILGNLLRNALEACATRATVTMTARRDGGRVAIAVRNPGTIPDDVRLRLFRRSFSTKSARGRGIGTWSVKLLAERYLGGSVAFSCADGATTFTVSLPAD